MAKSFKTSVADMEVSRAGRKEKKQKKHAGDRAGEGFSLFSKAKDAELEDVFSKGVSARRAEESSVIDNVVVHLPSVLCSHSNNFEKQTANPLYEGFALQAQ